MASWIINLIVTGAMVGIGVIGAKVFEDSSRPKPIPVKVPKHRR